MATSASQRYEYFLPTAGLDVAEAQRNLHRLFGQQGHTQSIQMSVLRGSTGLYIRSSLRLDRDHIRRLAGETTTPLERLMVMDFTTDSRTDAPARDHRVPESQRQRPDRSAYAERGYAERPPSYSAVSYYDRDGGTRRGEERGGPSMPRYTPHTHSNHEEQYGGSQGPPHDARNDAFWFPPNAVSSASIAQRRESINGRDGAADQSPPGRYLSGQWYR